MTLKKFVYKRQQYWTKSGLNRANPNTRKETKKYIKKLEKYSYFFIGVDNKKVTHKKYQ